MRRGDDSMRDTPLVSIVVPAYNTGEYIAEMLGYASRQTYENIEVLVMDDGSTDRTAEVVASCARLDGRISLHRLSHGGVSSARNAGMRVARGEKLLFLDSDDTFERTLVEDCVRAMADMDVETVLYGYANKSDDAYGDQHVFEITGTYRGSEIVEEVIPRFLGHSFEDVDAWVRGEKGLRDGKEHTALWRAMLDSSVVSRHSLEFDCGMALGEDTKFINEYLLRTGSVGVLDKCLYYLTVRDGSANATSMADPALMLENKVKVIRAREEIAAIAKEAWGVDLWPCWRGTNLLSVMQLTLGFAKDRRRPLGASWQLLEGFMRDPAVSASVAEYSPAGGGRSLPFRLLKIGALPLLYLGAACLPRKAVRFT